MPVRADPVRALSNRIARGPGPSLFEARQFQMTTETNPARQPVDTTRAAEVNAGDRVVIFDTTLRDGEQCPGASMTLDEKLRVAEMLERLGVDVIEAGFAIASNGDFESVYKIAERSREAVICSLARAKHADIERAAEALKPARRRRIHTFISTSPLHRKFKLNMDEAQVLEAIADSVSFARRFTDDVEWSCEDGTRTEPEFLYRAIEVAIANGATTINVPDTVGYTMPEEYIGLIRAIRNNVPNIDKAILSAHCHNDLGLAVANSLAAVSAGARQVECTINGIGERAGNAALEEIVMAMRTRADLMGVGTGIDTTLITQASQLVSSVTGFPIQYNKSIVGRNAFAHESGIHQDGMLKNAQTYEIMTPESVGVNKSSLVMGKHSGRHAFKTKLKELGFELGDNALEDAFRRFKDLADRKKTVFDDDLVALVSDGAGHEGESLKLTALAVACGIGVDHVATVTIEREGTAHSASASGNGPVDAAFNAIGQAIPHEAVLQLYQVHAVTEGTDAQARVTVRLGARGRSHGGIGADPDTVVASASAYVNALAKLLEKAADAPEEAADPSIRSAAI